MVIDHHGRWLGVCVGAQSTFDVVCRIEKYPHFRKNFDSSAFQSSPNPPQNFRGGGF